MTDESYPAPRANDEVEWDDFTPDDYWEHNYRSLREDDRSIIDLVASFLSKHFADLQPRDLRGLDVGSGTNLYPALAMLPWCSIVQLADYSERNVSWLKQHVFDSESMEDWSWRPFWEQFTQHDGYSDIDWRTSRRLLASRSEIMQGNIFDLERAAYDVGTLFFVAESMTSYLWQFEAAIAVFLQSLRPAAPFAAAFMDSSTGYWVGGKPFPSVHEVTFDAVVDVMDRLGARVKVTKIGIPPGDRLRDGYQGMLVVVGRTSE